MGFLVEAIANSAPYIYAACGLLALFQLYRTWQVRAERRQAVFALERDKAVDDLFRIFLSALSLLMAMGFTYFASTTLRTAMSAVESTTLLSSPGGSQNILQWISTGADPDADFHARTADRKPGADPHRDIDTCAG